MPADTAPSSPPAFPETASEVRTFLIADVRGYTHFTQQQGDEAAARLAARFATLMREGVDAHGGQVLELRGDEALAVFGSARQALRAAVAVQASFVDATAANPVLPLAVGMGLDAGEAVLVERTDPRPSDPGRAAAPQWLRGEGHCQGCVQPRRGAARGPRPGRELRAPGRWRQELPHRVRSAGP